MEILCLMGLFPKEYESTIIDDSISGMQNAANKLQWAIVDGLAQQKNVNLHIINSLFIGSFPKRYRKLSIPSFDFDAGQNVTGCNVGFLNIPIVKLFDKYRSVKKKIDKWLEVNKGKECVVLAYAMTSPFVELLSYIAVKHKNVKCILFVPDLPEYMNMAKKSKIYNQMKKKHISHLKKHLHDIDGYILLTEPMKEWFEWDIKYTVIEGIYSKPAEMEIENEMPREKVILYTGGLCEAYGILDLVDAFKEAGEADWKLELIGDGELMPTLEEMARKDDRIVLRGLMPNRQVVERQKQVSILVNPRKGNQAFTKYSFPSKTIEYMASGTLMVGYKLPGMPDEYTSYFYEIPSHDAAFMTCLKQVIHLSQNTREEMGWKAKEFIEENKNAKKQCSKIIELIAQL